MDIVFQKLHNSKDQLAKVKDYLQKIRTYNILMLSVTTLPIPFLKSLNFDVVVSTIDSAICQSCFGLTSSFLKCYSYLDDAEMKNYCYNETPTEKYYLIRPIRDMIMNHEGFGVEVDEPNLSGSVWKQYKTSTKLRGVLRSLMMGDSSQKQNFKIYSTTVSDMFTDEGAICQLLWHYGMIRREKIDNGYILKPTMILRGETLNNYLKDEIIKTCHIEFDHFLSLNDWQALVNNVFFEFNRTLSCFDFPLTIKFGIIESTVQMCMNILSGRQIYKALPQQTNAGGLCDILLVPQFPNSTVNPAALECKVTTVDDLVRVYNKNFCEFSKNLKSQLREKCLNALADMQTKDYIRSALLDDYNSPTCISIAFCRSICFLGVQKLHRSEGNDVFLAVGEPEVFEPAHLRPEQIRKIFRVISYKVKMS